MSSRVKDLVRKVLRDRNRRSEALAGGSGSPALSFSWETLSPGLSEKIVSAKMVAAFMPLSDEPDISDVLSYFVTRGASLCFPKVNGEEMAFFQADPSSCREIGSFGILEPEDGSEEVKIADIDLVLVPAMAFDGNGVRLGRGKGYYDKCFSQGKSGFSGVFIGVSAKKNLFGHLPFDVWDLTVDAILTEEGLKETGEKERGSGK